jgi:hypothetical protein
MATFRKENNLRFLARPPLILIEGLLGKPQASSLLIAGVQVLKEMEEKLGRLGARKGSWGP